MAAFTIETTGIAVHAPLCWKCGAGGGQVGPLICGHRFCNSCLEGQHVDGCTEGCKQPCMACFKTTVPKKRDIRGRQITGIGALALQGGSQAALTSSQQTDVLPCYIHKYTETPDESKRELAVLTSVEAMRRHEEYEDRAKYIGEKFDEKYGWGWRVVVRKATGPCECNVSCRYTDNNYIDLRVGDCLFTIWRCKP